MNKNSVLVEYFMKYKMIYMKIIIVFFIGIIIGVAVINAAKEEKILNLTEYVKELVQNVKNKDNIDYSNSFLVSIVKNIKTIGILWIFGYTIISSIFVYLNIGYQGFKLGYTISNFILILGIKKGMILSLSSLLLQNIIFIPTLFLLSESGIKLCNEIKKNRNNIKRELWRHFIIFMLCICLIILSSFIEVYFSTKILIFFKEIL